MSPRRVAIGFSPHSGWAALVMLGGTAEQPEVLARRRVEMADPRLPGSRQPYHAVEGLAVSLAEARLARFRETATKRAVAAIEAALAHLGRRGYAAAACGILEGSGRRGLPLESVLASHALIHTADGQHFRDALASAAERSGLAVHRVRASDLLKRAAARLSLTEEALRQRVQALGRPLGPPWGADQKSAALLAWLLLTEVGPQVGKPGQVPPSRLS
jgi:hypothetical protein